MPWPDETAIDQLLLWVLVVVLGVAGDAGLVPAELLLAARNTTDEALAQAADVSQQLKHQAASQQVRLLAGKVTLIVS